MMRAERSRIHSWNRSVKDLSDLLLLIIDSNGVVAIAVVGE